jgi:hypothetical protein
VIKSTEASAVAPMDPGRPTEAGAAVNPRAAAISTAEAKRVSRSPKRITITVPYETYQRLMVRSEQEGRSLSNLSAFLLESRLGRNNPD